MAGSSGVKAAAPVQAIDVGLCTGRDSIWVRPLAKGYKLRSHSDGVPLVGSYRGLLCLFSSLRS